MSIRQYSKYGPLGPLIYNIQKLVYTQIMEASALSLVQKILVHMRCAKLAHNMYIITSYAHAARNDLIYRDVLRLSAHRSIYVVVKA